MKHIISVVFFFFLLFKLLISNVYGQVLSPLSDVTLGSSGGDYLIKAIPTSDGGYFLVGFVNTVNTDVSGPAQGRYDYWVIKTDAKGDKQWDRLLGSAANDFVSDAKEDLINGGFVIIGHTEAANAGRHISTASKGGPIDIWVVKLSSNGSSIIWEKRLGGNAEDYGSSIIQTADGNYLIAGFTNSSPNTGDLGSDPARGNFDYRLISLSAAGVVLWDKRIGGSSFDGSGFGGGAIKIIQTSDGGYLIGGRSFSRAGGDKTANNIGSGSDIWLVKMDAMRTIQWDVTLGGEDEDKLTSITETSDGYIVGATATIADPVLGSDKNKDYSVTKINKSGTMIWQNTYGGLADDELSSLIPTSDGGYLLGGTSLSGKEADKSEPGYGGADYWLVKLLSDGSKEYDATFGGPAGDYLADVIATSDGGLLLAGFSGSQVGGNKTAFNKGIDDFWLLKLGGIVPLPIDLIFFNAQLIGKDLVELSWSTAGEKDNALFTVERSSNGQSFYHILEVPGAGNSNSIINYAIVDNSPIPGRSYYRLKQTDIYGKYTYSKVVSIETISENVCDVIIVPNPSDGVTLNLKLSDNLREQDVLINIQDILGQQVLKANLHTDSNDMFSLLNNSAPFKKGIYFLTIETQNCKLTKKLIIQ
jgi:hypothetical protein